MENPQRDPRGRTTPWKVAIIGAGPGGMCMAIALEKAGIRDFVILEKDGYEVMLQTVASMNADIPQTAPPPGASLLYIEVEDLAAIEAAMAGYELLVPRRKTFYGDEEIFVREPGGNVVGFAQFGAES